MTGWLLTEVVGVSADGLVFTGNGFNPDGIPEAFVVNLIPEPTSVMLLAVGLPLLTRRRVARRSEA